MIFWHWFLLSGSYLNLLQAFAEPTLHVSICVLTKPCKNNCASDEIYDNWVELGFKHLPEQFWRLWTSWKKNSEATKWTTEALSGFKVPYFWVTKRYVRSLGQLVVIWTPKIWSFPNHSLIVSLITPAPLFRLTNAFLLKWSFCY